MVLFPILRDAIGSDRWRYLLDRATRPPEADHASSASTATGLMRSVRRLAWPSHQHQRPQSLPVTSSSATEIIDAVFINEIASQCMNVDAS